MVDNDDPSSSRPSDDLLQDPLLRGAPIVEGFRVLEPAVLYAKIGRGGMGAVYRGRHYKLDLDVAVKCLRPSLVDEDEDFVRRFEREARLAASIAHQNVVRVMDVQEKNGLHYLVMEYVRGETAAERVRRKGPLAEREALAIFFGATAGLAEAHARGIVHRDIKPENIMVSMEGRVKLADLGLAKSTSGVDGRSVSMPASRIMGTPQYMPPEQWETTDVNASADIWALGATFYFLVTGQAGIAGSGTYHAIAKRIQEQDYPTLRAARADLRPEVHTIFEKCVQRNCRDRFADARQLLRELKKLAVDDEDALIDPGTGTGIARACLVTPPPRQTLLRIRAQIETVPASVPSEAETVVARSGRSEALTVPATGRAEPESPTVSSKSRDTKGLLPRWVPVAVLLIVNVGCCLYAAPTYLDLYFLRTLEWEWLWTPLKVFAVFSWVIALVAVLAFVLRDMTLRGATVALATAVFGSLCLPAFEGASAPFVLDRLAGTGINEELRLLFPVSKMVAWPILVLLVGMQSVGPTAIASRVLSFTWLLAHVAVVARVFPEVKILWLGLVALGWANLVIAVWLLSAGRGWSRLARAAIAVLLGSPEVVFLGVKQPGLHFVQIPYELGFGIVFVLLAANLPRAGRP